VVAGIGAAPEITLAQEAGLAIDNGIACDATLQTSDPDIYAAGDCGSFPHALFGEKRMRLEAWGRNAVLIALTGWGQEQDKQAAKAAGFDEHLTKPVDPDSVEQVLNGLLGGDEAAPSKDPGGVADSARNA
jgi:CheY-like chemotaxis protein